jgi:transcriptional regulator with GAF, ATPase, and Fis domain
MFELCDKGTILLDEIGELPPNLQAKLLQVLQHRQFSRLGGRSLVTVDVRILAATNVDIHHALKTKRFREDLFYRLNAFTIHLPPLRERQDEILSLLQYFMQRLGMGMGLSPKPVSDRVIDACLRYSWPGNVRELENFVKRFLVLDDEYGTLAELGGEHGARSEGPCGPTRSSRIESPRDLKSMVRRAKAATEKEAIRAALHQSGGNRKEAARLLNICTKGFSEKAKRYGLFTGEPSGLAAFSENAAEVITLGGPARDEKAYS